MPNVTSFSYLLSLQISDRLTALERGRFPADNQYNEGDHTPYPRLPGMGRLGVSRSVYALCVCIEKLIVPFQSQQIFYSHKQCTTHLRPLKS